jgi:glycosyltransferase involved in cell wall biosynthesis
MPHIEESVRSLLAQSFVEFDLIIGDDGSDDATAEVLSRLESEDARIRLFRRDRKSGPAEAANWVISNARAPLVAIAHADDIAHPDRLRRQVDLFQDRPDVVLVGALNVGIDSSGRTVHPMNLWRLAFPTSFAPMTHSSVMFRRADFEAVGGYRKEADCWEDLDLYWRLSRRGRILVIPEVLTRYRYSKTSLRERAQAEGLEHSLERMYRSVAIYQKHGDYDSLLTGEHEAPNGNSVHPRIFVARSWTRVWSGKRSLVFGQMLRRARLGLDLASMQSFAFVLWASVSPKSLRLALQVVTHIRNRVARARIGGRPHVEWNPRKTVSTTDPAESVEPVRADSP